MTEYVHKYERIYRENKEYIESVDCLSYPTDLFNEMRTHLMLSWNKPSPAHSAELTSLKVAKYPTLQINERQKEMLLSLSADLQLDEIECFELAMDLSSPGVKTDLEQAMDLDGETLDFPSALRELFFFRKTRMIMTLFDLLKARASHDFPTSKKEVIMRLTNQLFNDQLGSKIMQLITEQLSLLLDQNRSKTKAFSEKMAQYLQRLAECMFYMFYRTQITRGEADELMELIRVLSNALIPTLAEKLPSTSPSSSSSASGDCPVDVALFPVLVILQLTHVRALNQVDTFYSRDVDSAPFGHGVEGNALITEADTEWDYGKDSLLGRHASLMWENRMVRGFTCLSLGVIREPFVEQLTMHPRETSAFFDKAYECNAYSYIRLCLLPTIQGYDDLHSVDSGDFRDLLLSTLVGDARSGLIVDLMNCFVNEVYHMEFPFNEWGRERDLERRRYDLDAEVYEAGSGGSGEADESPERVIFTANPDDNPPIACDCVDDILDLLTVTVMAQPAFALKLMHSSGAKHPFVSALVEIIDREFHELKYPGIRFFTALANSQQPNFAVNIHSLISGARVSFNEMLDWRDIFEVIESSTSDLQQLAAATVGGRKAAPGPLQTQTGVLVTSPPPLPDEYFLEDIVNLVGSVVRDARVVRELIALQLDPVKKLFDLLVCQVGVTLKGAILRAVAALCSALSRMESGGDDIDGAASVSRLEVLEQVWKYMEDYHLLPSSPLGPKGVGGSGSGSSNLNYGGLRYELENVESGTLGQYPVTLGFLTLLVSLLADGTGGGGGDVPHNLGHGRRIPGIICYVDYVIGDILLKLETRRYLPANFSGEGQKWKIAALSVRVLTLILQGYNINSLTADDLLNTQQEQPPGVVQQSTCSSIFQTPSEQLTSMALDFQDATVCYPLFPSDVSSRQRPSGQQQFAAITNTQTKHIHRDEMRPKTVGFAVMSSLLDQKRGLLLFLVQMLQENSPKNISYIRQQEMLHLASLSVEHSIENSELSLCRVREEIAAKFRDIQLPQGNQFYDYHQNIQQELRRQGGQVQGQYQQQDEPHVSIFFAHFLRGTEVGWDDMFYDNAHWRLQAAVSVVGLLYEASLREVAFLDRVRSVGPLSMIRSTASWGEGGGGVRSATSVLVDVQVDPLSTSLLTDLQWCQLVRHQQGQWREGGETELPLSCILAYLSFLPEKQTVLCSPSLEIISLRILKHVAQNQTSQRVLHSLKDMGVNAQKMIENCNYFIENGDEDRGSREGYGVMRHSGGVGEVVAGQIFTSSQVTSVRPVPGVEGDSNIGGGGGKRDAVLDLLLTSLRPHNDCLCHYLLFGLGGIGGEGVANCLDAVLELIQGEVGECALAVTHPFQALQCFELVYRLHVSPLTSSATRRAVSRKSAADQSLSGHFMIDYLKFYLEFRRKQLAVGGLEGGNCSLEDTARLDCCSWALKVIAMELSLHSSSNEHDSVEQILAVLFSPHAEYTDDSGGFSGSSIDTTSCILLQLLQLVPLSLEFNFGSESDDSNEAVVIQCMRESSKPYSVNQAELYQHPGRDIHFNESPGEFMFVDIPHFVLLLKTFYQYSAPGSVVRGVSGKVKEEDERRIIAAVQVAEEYNTYISTMAAMSNYCHAFRQLVEVALFKYPTVLLGNFQLISTDAEDSPGQTSLGGDGYPSQVLQAAGTAVQKLLTNLLSPCLSLLVSSPAMEMVHAEQVSMALLAMFDTLRCITLESKAAQCQAVDTLRTPPPLTASTFSNLLTHIILAVLRQGGAGSPRHASSAKYRAQLYLSFFSLLMCGGDMSSRGHVGYSVEEDMQVHCKNILQKYVVELVDVLGGDIALGVATSSGESADPSLVSCASGAFSALAGVLTHLGPCTDRGGGEVGGGGRLSMTQQIQRDGCVNYSNYSCSKRFRDSLFLSPGYLHGLNTLLDKGHLARLFSSAGLTSGEGTGEGRKRHKTCSGIELEGRMEIHTLECVLSLCAHLACSSEGVEMLLELGVFQALNSLAPLPPPSRHPQTSAGAGQGQEESKEPFSIDNLEFLLHKNRGSRSTSHRQTHPQSPWHALTDDGIDEIMSLLLLMFRAGLSSSQCADMFDHCALFLTRNHSAVVHYLRLQSPTLSGMRIAHSIVSVFCQVASAPSSQLKTPLPSWESRLGAKGDSLSGELSKLLAALGANPLPPDMWRGPVPLVSGGRPGGRLPTWWSVVHPSNEEEVRKRDTPGQAPSCLCAVSFHSLSSSVGQWNSFDLEKFQIGLQIIERCSSFFRIRCNQWVKLAASMSGERSNTVGGVEGNGEGVPSVYDELGLGLLKLDLGMLSFSFQSLGGMYLQINQKHVAEDSSRWLQSPHVLTQEEGGVGGVGDADIRSAVLHSVESLLCAIFDISKASNSTTATASAGGYHHHRPPPVDMSFRVQVQEELEQCCTVATSFPPHSFVHQIGRSLLPS